jgi:hypothetical protein
MSRVYFHLCLVACSVAIAICAATAPAATINVILSDFDVIYSGSTGGGAIYDVVSFAGGNLNEAESDELASAVFELDGAPPPASGGDNVLMTGAGSEIYGDLKISGLGGTLPLNMLIDDAGTNGGGFGLDMFIATGETLRIGLTSIDAVLSPAVFFFNGEGTVLEQDLPFGLQFDTSQPVFVSFTATLPALPMAEETSMAAASGAVTISGTSTIPEPSGLALLGLAAVIGSAVVRRRS